MFWVVELAATFVGLLASSCDALASDAKQGVTWQRLPPNFTSEHRQRGVERAINLSQHNFMRVGWGRNITCTPRLPEAAPASRHGKDRAPQILRKPYHRFQTSMKGGGEFGAKLGRCLCKRSLPCRLC